MESRRPFQASEEGLTVPEPVHLVRDDASTQPDVDDDDRPEATELQAVSSTPTAEGRRLSRIITPGLPKQNWHDPFRKVWRHHIRISVPHLDCRDHLANERTFLGYLRTSIALSILGITVAQLYRLENSAEPGSKFDYFLLSKPIAGIFQASAIFIILVGATRFYRQQKAMSLGKVHAGGWEIYLVCGFVLLVLVAMFGVHVGLDVVKADMFY